MQTEPIERLDREALFGAGAWWVLRTDRWELIVEETDTRLTAGAPQVERRYFVWAHISAELRDLADRGPWRDALFDILQCLPERIAGKAMAAPWIRDVRGMSAPSGGSQ